MKATAWVLLLLAGSAAAQEPRDLAEVHAALAEERYEEAKSIAEQVLQHAPDLQRAKDLRAKAVNGIARTALRARGYDAALEILEPHVDHPYNGWYLTRIAVWAGREEWGLDVLRNSALEAVDRAELELEPLYFLGRYEEAARVARAAGFDIASWYEEEAQKRIGFDAQTRRAARLAAGAALTILGTAWWLIRKAPSPGSS